MHADKITQNIRSLSFRQAMARYHIGQKNWERIKAGGDWRPRKGSGHCQEVVQKIPADVKEMPHLNTLDRAKKLGLRTERVKAVRKSQGISKRNPDFGGTPLCRL